QVAPRAARPGPGVAALPCHRAFVGAEEPEHDAHRGRLAGSIGTEEPEDLARRDRQPHTVEGLHVAEALTEIVDLERHRHPALPRPSAALSGPPQTVSAAGTGPSSAIRPVLGATLGPKHRRGGV